MNIKYTALAVTSLLASFSLSADQLTADLSNDAFKVEITSERLIPDVRLSLSGLGTDDDVNVFAATAVMAGPVQQYKEINAGLGARLYYADAYDNNMQAFALGGFAQYNIPTAKEVSLIGEFFYAPGITSSDDIDYQTDLNVRVNYQLLPNGAVYAGYRYLQTNIEDSRNLILDKGIHLGFEFSF
ncbi:YfaZ family outer membrane protein [Catenovulum sediminis]|uniref:YfaZ family outer membrane protein n=1 Tax=Catenovulum sediminis TaxID=1740262 RepID=A0ABV1RDH5_9ALTE|nr:YfaZ family outer membrane protein [Catenovulum sediminis]